MFKANAHIPTHLLGSVRPSDSLVSTPFVEEPEMSRDKALGFVRDFLADDFPPPPDESTFCNMNVLQLKGILELWMSQLLTCQKLSSMFADVRSKCDRSLVAVHDHIELSNAFVGKLSAVIASRPSEDEQFPPPPLKSQSLSPKKLLQSSPGCLMHWCRYLGPAPVTMMKLSH